MFWEQSSSIEGYLPSTVVFHQRSSSVKGRLPSKVVFLQRTNCVETCFETKGPINQPRYQIQDGLWPNNKTLQFK